MNQANNPYAPTTASLIPLESTFDPDLVLAGRWRRFFTYLVDWVGMTVLLGVLSFTGIAPFVADPMSAWHTEFLRSSLASCSVMVIYYWPQESLACCTLGKLICGTRVVDLEGLKPGPGRIALRTLARMIPLEPLSIFFGGRPTGWHDSMSNTRVICLKKLKQLRSGEVELLVSERDAWESAEIQSTQDLPPDWKDWSDARKAVWEMQQQSRRSTSPEGQR